MNIGDSVAIGKLQGSMAFEERDHVRRGLQKRIDHYGIEALAQFLLKVGTGQ